MRRYFVVLLLVLFHCASCVAQVTQFLHGGGDLSSALINSIGQDSDGMVWICTDNGLNRHDGAKVTSYYTSQDNSSNFSFFFQDSKGHRFACGSEHIFFFDPRKDGLVALPSYQLDGEELKFRTYGIMEMSNGDVVAYTSGHGLFYLEDKDGRLCFRQRENHFPTLFINYLFEDSKHRLWASTDGGVVCWDGKKLNAVSGAGNADLRFRTLTVDKKGRLWCISELDGLWLINDKNYTMSKVPGTSGMGVTSILTARENTLLIGTNGHGLLELDINKMQFLPFDFRAGRYNSRNLNVHALYNDRNGNLWVGCYQKGVAIIPRGASRFITMGQNTPFGDFIGNCCVQTLTCDAMGNLWIACDGDGLYSINTRNLPRSKNVENTTVHYAPSVNFPSTVMSLYPDRNGRLWIGTWLSGLWVMDLATKACHMVKLPTETGSANVFSMVEDGIGQLWIGTCGDGLFVMDMKTGEVKPVGNAGKNVYVKDNENALHNRWVNKVFLGKNNIIYVATTDGLCGVDAKTHSFLKVFHGKNSILRGHVVNTGCELTDGRIFLGVGKGLLCYDPKTKTVRNYGESEGLLGNSVSSIVDDHKGRLWISTNKGISCLTLKDGKFSNYASNQGMFNNEFSRNACFMQPDGMLHFGGTEGVISIDSKKLIKQDDKPEVYFTALYLNGRAITGETESGGERILDADMFHAKRVELGYYDNSFSIELSSMNFGMSESIQYEYRMDDGEWQILPVSQNTVSFSNLKSGKHILEVRAKEWNIYGDVKKLEIVIRQPWYNTWWAWLIYITIICTIGYVVRRNILARKEAAMQQMKIRQQEELNEAKIQFFMNISHEIRTPMTLIVSPLQRLIQTEVDQKLLAVYALMNRNAQRIMQLVNQLLDVRKIDKGQMKLYFREVDMVPYLRELTDGFRDLCETKNISIRFDCDRTEMPAWIDPMNFDKIINNLLSNAFKYTPKNGKVEVVLSLVGDGSYQIQVVDTGKGLTDDAMQHVFERFYQHYNVENQVVQGSGVGLNLTRSLVQMHHGDITVRNNESGIGCCFVVTLPLGSAHLSKDEMIDDSEVEEIATVQSIQDIATYQKPEAVGDVEGIIHGSRKRVLVVEDDEEIQAYLVAELRQIFGVSCVNNGKEALDAIRKKMPDLIISDVMMPVMDGITMLKHIRQDTSVNNIPVIMLTAKSADQDNIEALDFGADAYITKPFNIEILRHTAINLVQRQQQLRNIFDGRQTPKIDEVKMQSPDERLMERIMKVINANLANPDLGNDMITSEVGISRGHLYRKLKEMTNLSLRDFIKNIRLTEAARLLAEHRYGVSEVAERCGFENVSYFTVLFKQKYGVPPSAYNMMIRDGKDKHAE